MIKNPLWAAVEQAGVAGQDAVQTASSVGGREEGPMIQAAELVEVQREVEEVVEVVAGVEEPAEVLEKVQ